MAQEGSHQNYKGRQYFLLLGTKILYRGWIYPDILEHISRPFDINIRQCTTNHIYRRNIDLMCLGHGNLKLFNDSINRYNVNYVQ